MVVRRRLLRRRHLPFPRSSRVLENELHSEDHAANPAAKLLWLQECGIGRQHITLRCESGGDSGVAENISVAECVVWMVQDVKRLSADLEVHGLAEVEILVDGEVPCPETGGADCVSSEI